MSRFGKTGEHPSLERSTRCMCSDALEAVAGEFRKEVLALAPFDACAWVGRPFQSHRTYANVPELRAGLRELGYSGALIAHTRGELYDPMERDEAFAAQIQESPNTPGVLMLVPRDTIRDSSIEQTLRWGISRGF